ncbi:hypothetical protein CROQUDRAFT_671819 [Cronartium quercuum f. sp. fusiforme G11]|uniref:EF-hand domain-containing protein n=1 Tax=Cronartium quercuum f. sp. fusiforme G11 TaxID=708437 RepID=A0A9P6NEK4_9BASI|nr:hypothetical protein CROQUDRAFT_671819 [Cronartium quercuum f. sp. fusiforme G11]
MCTHQNLYNHNSWTKIPAIAFETSYPSKEGNPISPYQQTRAQRVFFDLPSQLPESKQCHDLWISQQTLSPVDLVHQKLLAAQSSPILDVLWTWVNGSDPVINKVRDRYASLPNAYPTNPVVAASIKAVPGLGTENSHFRQHNELRYSMRSVAASLTTCSNLIRAFNLFTVDFSVLDLRLAGVDTDLVAGPSDHTKRWGSIPSWINQSVLDPNITSPDQKPLVRILHHSEAYNGNVVNHPLIFDSFAIESRIPKMRALKDTVLYLNDDYFTLRMSKSFHSDLDTILTGPVLHLQFDLPVGSENPWSISGGKGNDIVTSEGEWTALGYTTLELNELNVFLLSGLGNWLLDARFGVRERCYNDHIARVFSMPIVRELASVWEKEFAATEKVGFRSHGPEVNLAYLHAWYLVEKHCEALLYSFVMLRIDKDLDGMISLEEYANLLTDVGAEDSHTILKVEPMERSRRASRFLDAFRRLGIPLPLETEYIWTAPDGYPLGSKETCQLSIASCIDYNSATSSQDLFRRLAFEHVRCGDCLLKQLINRDDLSSVLPPVEPGFVTSNSVPWSEADHLGPTSSWHQVSFEVDLPLVRKVGKREMAIRKLERYNYVIGYSNYSFVTIRDPQEAALRLFPLYNQSHPSAYLTINDDIVDPGFISYVQSQFQLLFRKRFSSPIGWWEHSV